MRSANQVHGAHSTQSTHSAGQKVCQSPVAAASTGRAATGRSTPGCAATGALADAIAGAARRGFAGAATRDFAVADDPGRAAAWLKPASTVLSSSS